MPDAFPSAVVVLVVAVVPMLIMGMRFAIPHMGWLHNIAALRGDYPFNKFFEFASIQPDATAAWAIINFNSVLVCQQ